MFSLCPKDAINNDRTNGTNEKFIKETFNKIKLQGLTDKNKSVLRPNIDKTVSTARVSFSLIGDAPAVQKRQ